MKGTVCPKLLIISRTLPYLGGREVMVHEMLKHYSVGGVSLITPDEYPGMDGVEKTNANRPFKELLSWANGQNVDVISCHTFYLAELAIFLSKKLKKPLVFTLHGIFIDHYDRKYGKFLKRIYKNSDVVIVVSENFRKRLGLFFGDARKLVTIRNGVDVAGIDSFDAGKENYRRSLRLPLTKYITITPARLSYIKGLEYLAIAARELEDVILLICSPNGRTSDEEGKYKNELVNLIGARHRNVRFLNLNHDQMPAYLKASDAVVLPSLTEGISIAILEGMASRRPILTTSVGGTTEIIKNGVSGYLFRPKDPEAIVRTIEKVRSTDTSEICENARRIVEGKFSIDTMFGKYDKLFSKVKKINENKQ